MIKADTAAAKILTSMVLSGGQITADVARLHSLTMLSKQSLYNAVNILKEHGYIESRYSEKKIAAYRLKLFDRRKKEYMSILWNGGDDYKREAVFHDKEMVTREQNLAELIFLMMSSGINVTPDSYSLPPENSEHKGFPFFIPSRIARRSFPVEDLKGRATRYNGLLVTLNGVFPVYNFSSSSLDRITILEANAVKTADLARQYYLPESESSVKHDYRYSTASADLKNEFIPRGCIVVTDDYLSVKDFFTPAKKKGTKGPVKGLYGLNDCYENIYVVPMQNPVTAGYMNMFMPAHWHKRLTGLVLGSAGKRTPDVFRLTDDFDGTFNGKKVICFIDGDIRRLQKLTHMDADKAREYLIVCYDFQEELLHRILPPVCEIKAYSMARVNNRYFKLAIEEGEL